MARTKASPSPAPVAPAPTTAPIAVTATAPTNVPAPGTGNTAPAVIPSRAPTDYPARVEQPTPALPAIQPFVPRGLEDVGREDIVIPRLSIVQPTSKVGTPGHFRDVVAGEDVKRLEGLVPLKWRKGRVFFEKPEDKEPCCASDDRVRPAKRIEHPVRDVCAGCPASGWTEENGKRKHPKCQETYTLLCVWRGSPYFLTFKSSAIGPVKRLLTQLSLTAARLRKDAFAFRFDVGLEEQVFTVGKAFVPKFENLKPIADAAEVETYASIFDTYATVAPSFDPPAEAGEADADVPAPPAAAGTTPSFDFAK